MSEIGRRQRKSAAVFLCNFDEHTANWIRQVRPFVQIERQRICPVHASGQVPVVPGRDGYPDAKGSVNLLPWSLLSADVCDLNLSQRTQESNRTFTTSN